MLDFFNVEEGSFKKKSEGANLNLMYEAARMTRSSAAKYTLVVCMYPPPPSFLGEGVPFPIKEIYTS